MAFARSAALVVLLAISARTMRAAADEPRPKPRIALAWTRGSGATSCISPDELLERVRAWSSAQIELTTDREGADFVLVGHIERRAAGFRTELSVHDARGEPLGDRTFDAPAKSCRALDEPLVLAVVLLVESPRVRIGMRSERTTDAPSELVPPLYVGSPPDRTPPLALPRPRPSKWKIELGAGAAMALGLMPNAAVGPAVFGSVSPPHFAPIALRASAYPFGNDQRTVPGEGVTVRGFEGGPEVCPLELERRSVDIRACVGAHVAALFVRPLGPRSSSGAPLFLLIPVRTEIRLRGAIEPYAAFTAHFTALPPTFVYRAPDGEERTSFAVRWAVLGLELGVAWAAPL